MHINVAKQVAVGPAIAPISVIGPVAGEVDLPFLFYPDPQIDAAWSWPDPFGFREQPAGLAAERGLTVGRAKL